MKKNRKLTYRGVVYDVGLQFNPGSYSVEPFDSALVEYDMRAIANELHANAVRIEGEDISRLVTATRIANTLGLKVFFNPWKMGAADEENIRYMAEAANAAEKLRTEGINLIFVAGCEYSIFNKGIFPGETLNERIGWMSSQFAAMHSSSRIQDEFRSKLEKLNKVLASVAKEVRKNFGGQVTYSAGTWEMIDWSIFDIVGIDYYRMAESDQGYVSGLDRFRSEKPLVVMEVGSCAYEGAGKLGPGGYAVLEGVNPDGTGIFAGGKVPVRSEKEQADYVETQVNLLNSASVDAVFVYVFSFPIMPIGEGAKDRDMTSFALVKTYPKNHPKASQMPPWEPKEAYLRLAKIYEMFAQQEKEHPDM